ncbi:MAG: TRAP transporter substrate-binding protein [Desulfobacteraceae bacterium]|nr:TRAP transporter substrate-binding protein [Desulfobacteraceae bacterium]
MNKSYLKISIVFAIVVSITAFGLFSGIAQAGFVKDTKYTLKFGHCLPPDNPYHIGAIRFAELCKVYSKGELETKVYPSFQLGSEQEQFKACQMGTQDISLGAINNAAPFWPPLNVFIMPYAFRSNEHAFNVADGSVGKELKEKFLKATNLRMISLYHLGFRSFGNSKRAIYKPEDLKGVLFRVPKNPVMIDTTKALGADVIAMAWSEVFNALKQGVVDGHDVPPGISLSMKFYDAGEKYYSFTKHFYAFACVLMSEKRFQKLPKHIQDIIIRAGKEAEDYQRWVSIQNTLKAIKGLQEHGVKVNEVDDMKAFRILVKPVWSKYSTKPPEIKYWLDKISAVPGE